MKLQYHAIYCLIILALILSFALLWTGKYNCPKCPELPVVTAPIQPKSIQPGNLIKPSVDSTKPQPKSYVAPKKKVVKDTAEKEGVFLESLPPPTDITFVVPEDYAPCSELLHEYYTLKFYSENYSFSDGIVTVQDSVSENIIQYRKVDFNRTSPDYTPRNKIYLGMQGATNFEKIRDFGPNAMIVTKRDLAIFIHWNALDKPANLTLGGYWLLSFRRH